MWIPSDHGFVYYGKRLRPYYLTHDDPVREYKRYVLTVSLPGNETKVLATGTTMAWASFVVMSEEEDRG